MNNLIELSNLINFSDLAKKDIFDLIELANNFKSEDSLDYRNENLFPDKKIVSMFCDNNFNGLDPQDLGFVNEDDD